MAKDERGESNENSNISLTKMNVESNIKPKDEESLVQALCKREGMKEDGNNERNQDKGDCTTMTERLEKNSNIDGDVAETIITPACGSPLCLDKDKDERGGDGNNMTENDRTMDDRLENKEDDYSEEAYISSDTVPSYNGWKPTLSHMSPIRGRVLSISTSNALDNFEMVEGLMEDLSLIVLLDYDGTLTPIVSDPAAAVLSDSVRSILQDLAEHFVTGVISGRSLGKIRDFVKVPGLYYAGSHGFDILAPCPNPPPVPSHTENCIAALEELDSSYTRYQVAIEYLPVLQEIKSELEEGIKSLPGASVEDNTYAISLHYRNCDRKFIPQVDQLARGILDRHEGLRLRGGKEVYEIQPDIKWNKGSAVVWLLEMLGLLTDVAGGGDVLNGNEDGIRVGYGSPDVFTVFIGDDLSDEDAFKLFTGSHEGRQPGLGILVSEESRHTNAAFTLHNPVEVADFLSRLVGIGQSRGLEPISIRAKHNVEINGVQMLKTPSVKDIAVQIAHLVETDHTPSDGSP